MRVEEKSISDEATKFLLSYGWPGNVRELENTIEHAVLLAKRDQINMEDLPEKIREAKPLELVTDSRPSTPTLETIEKIYIYWVLNQTGWQKSKAASILGIDASTLYRKIERYHLKSPLTVGQDH